MKARQLAVFDSYSTLNPRKQDLRSPLTTRLSRGSSIRYLRVITLYLLDV